MRGLDQIHNCHCSIPLRLYAGSMSTWDVMDGKVNNLMRSDVGRRECSFVFRMTFLFDIAILDVELKRKNLIRGQQWQRKHIIGKYQGE